MSAIQTSAQVGMRTMNQSLFELYRQGKITAQDAREHSSDVADLERLMERHGSSAGAYSSARRAR